MSDDTPISWMALEEGAELRGSDGAIVGKVAQVVADVQKDIFSGLTFRPGALSTQRFIPADLVKEITTEAVHLTISGEEAESLEEYQS